MSDRSRHAITVIAARIGRTDLGEATVAFEDDALSVAVREMPSEAPLRVEFSTIEAVSVAGSEVTLPLRGGTRLTFVCDSPGDARDAILHGCRSLPELTSALRTFGSRRGNRSTRPTASDEQRRFFAPMLRARREAGDAATPQAAIAAFDASALIESTHRALKGFAEQRFAEHGSARRALEAHLFEASEALDASFGRLREAASVAIAQPDDLHTWRVWASALRAVFEAADRGWVHVDAVLEATPVAAPNPNSKKTQQKPVKKP